MITAPGLINNFHGFRSSGSSTQTASAQKQAQKQAQHSERTCWPGRGQCRAAVLFCLHQGTQYVSRHCPNHSIPASQQSHYAELLPVLKEPTATLSNSDDKHRRCAQPRDTVKNNSICPSQPLYIARSGCQPLPTDARRAQQQQRWARVLPVCTLLHGP